MRLVVVTPAGREHYLRLLGHYVLGSSAVSEWQLWDNCRNEDDRAYLRRLAASDPRCVIKTLPSANGRSESIGKFFQFCDDPSAIYLRLDDDIVYVEDGFFERFVRRMIENRGKALWYAPMIINNSVCNSLLQHFAEVHIEGPLTTQSMCHYSWFYSSFPEAMHPVLIEAVRRDRLDAFRVPDRESRMGRFSINALAFFGDEIVALGDRFLPEGKDEEDWFSAILPARLNRGGMILGDMLVAHFSFFTQEHWLLRTDILAQYYALAGLPAPSYRLPKESPWQFLLRLYRRTNAPTYRISLPG